MSAKKKRNSQRHENEMSPVMPVTKAQAARINFFSDYTFDMMADNEVEEFVVRNLIAQPNRVVTRQMLKSWVGEENTKDNSACLPENSAPMTSSSGSETKSKEVKFATSSETKSKEVKFVACSESQEKEVENARIRNNPGKNLAELVAEDHLAHMDRVVTGQGQKSILFNENKEKKSERVPQGNNPIRTRSKSGNRSKQAVASAIPGGHESVLRSPRERMIAGDVSQKTQNEDRTKSQFPEATEGFRTQRLSEPEIQYSENPTKRHLLSRCYSHKNTETCAAEEMQSKKTVGNKFRRVPHILRDNGHEMESKKSVGNEFGRDPQTLSDNGHEMQSKNSVGDGFGREPHNLSDNGHEMRAAKVKKKGLLSQNVVAYFPYGETMLGYWIRVVSQLLKLLSFAGKLKVRMMTILRII